MGRRVDGLASWADPFRLLVVIRHTAPAVLAELAGLLTPEREALLRNLEEDQLCLLDSSRSVTGGAFPLEWHAWAHWREENLRSLSVGGPLGSPGPIIELNDSVARWANRWNLTAPWVFRTAALTLWRWAARPQLERSHFESLPWAGYLQPNASPRLLKIHASNPEQAAFRARDKRQLGDAVATLRMRSDAHLVSFVHWQVLSEGVDRTRQVWRAAANMKTLPDAKTVLEMMAKMSTAFDFARRARARPGRPRRVRG